MNTGKTSETFQSSGQQILQSNSAYLNRVNGPQATSTPQQAYESKFREPKSPLGQSSYKKPPLPG